ncbi:MAG: hypothetical protein QW356_04465 [Candidatus Hadarchaeales archaeon]
MGQDPELCPQCGGGLLVRSDGQAEVICGSCGYVVVSELELDMGPEWRMMGEDLKGRTGPPMNPLLHDKGLSTTMDWRDEDAHDNELTPECRDQMRRLSRLQRMMVAAIDKNLIFALGEIKRMGALLSLPESVKVEAARIYRRVVGEHSIRGRSIEGVAAAALYAACRLCRIPRTLDEIVSVSRVGRAEVEGDLRSVILQVVKLPPSNPADFIPRFASELGLSGEVEAKAMEILRRAPRRLTLGKEPTGVAAAALYLAAMLCGRGKTQREVAGAVRTTTATIRHRCAELAGALGIDLATGTEGHEATPRRQPKPAPSTDASKPALRAGRPEPIPSKPASPFPLSSRPR